MEDDYEFGCEHCDGGDRWPNDAPTWCCPKCDAQYFEEE